MPIVTVKAFGVVCDVCHLDLVIPDGTGEPNRLQVDLFLTTLHAQAQASFMGWTFHHAHALCPQCSNTPDALQKET